MTETQFTADAGTTYFKIICGLGEVRPDGSDGDTNPDLMTLSGTVAITMAVDRVRYVDGDGRVRMLTLQGATYTIQASTGELIDKQGNVGVWLLNSASPGVDPLGFTYTATVTPAVGKAWAVTFSGDQTGTVDLVAIANVPSDTGVASLTSRVLALEAAGPGTPTTHDHDDRYFTEAEIASLLAGKVDASTIAELIRDTIAAALVPGANVTITPNDGADTITIAATGGGGGGSYEIRHDIAGGYDYLGTAPEGSLESASAWSITRITLTSPPVIGVATAAEWVNRTSEVYS